MKKKKLNLEKDLFGNKEYDKNEPIEINENVTLYYSKKITNRKVDKIIKELMDTVNYANEKGYRFPASNLDVGNYLKYLIFKYFTNMEEAVNTTDYYINTETFAKAYSKGWIIKVLEHLPKSEMQKVEDTLTSFLVTMNELESLPEEEQEKFVEELNKLKDKMEIYNGEYKPS